VVFQGKYRINKYTKYRNQHIAKTFTTEEERKRGSTALKKRRDQKSIFK